MATKGDDGARYRTPIKEDPAKVARRRRIEQLLEDQQARKEDPLWEG